MVVTLFWSRFRKDMDATGLAEYQADAARMKELAAGAPGFVSIKTYTADDGERLSVVMFESAEQQRAWRADAEHLQAQERGRDQYYDSYRMMICAPEREYDWVREADAAAGAAGD